MQSLCNTQSTSHGEEGSARRGLRLAPVPSSNVCHLRNDQAAAGTVKPSRTESLILTW